MSEFSGKFSGLPPKLAVAGGLAACDRDSGVSVLLAEELVGLEGPASKHAKWLLGLYKEEGIQGVHRLRGPFAFAVADPLKGLFYLVRDRLGLTPVYYSSDASGLAFAARIKDLPAPARPAAFEPEGVFNFLWGVRHPELTYYRGIRTVPPGRYLVAENGETAVREYWDAPFPSRGRADPRPDSALIEELHDRLQDSVDLHLPPERVKTGILLSGGLDSSIIGAMIRKSRDASPYCITFKSERFKKYDESHYARAVAGRLGWKITELDYKPEHIHEHFLDTLFHAECPTAHLEMQLAIPFFLLFRRIKEDGVERVFTGAGSDEILGGYAHHRLEKLRALVNRRPDAPRYKALYRRLGRFRVEDHDFFSEVHERILERYGHNLTAFHWIKGFDYTAERLPKILGPAMRDALGAKRWSRPLSLGIDAARCAGLGDLDRALYLEMKTRLANFILLEERQIPKAFGISPRLPFLDHELVEFAARLPERLKIRGMIGKFALKKAVDRYMPMKMFMRVKRGFNAPFARDVFQHEDSPLLAALFSKEAVDAAGVYDHKALLALLADYRAGGGHSASPAQYFMLERALTLQGLHRLFIQGKGTRL